MSAARASKAGWYVQGGALVTGVMMIVSVLACGYRGSTQPAIPVPQSPTQSSNEEAAPPESVSVCGDGVCDADETCPEDCAGDEPDSSAEATRVPPTDSGETPSGSGGGGVTAEPDDSLPASVQGELLWSAGGGGPGPKPESCGQGLVSYWLSTYGGYGLIKISEHPYRGIAPEQGVQGLTFTVNQCNLPTGTPVDVIITLPDGQVDRVSTTVASNTTLNVTWISIPGEPEGQYQVDAESGGAGQTMYFEVDRALYPIVRSLCRLPDSSRPHAILTGFEPGERVAVVVYETVGLLPDGSTARLEIHSHQNVVMDGEGTAIVEVPEIDGLVVAVGEHPDYQWASGSGTVPMPVDGFDSLECGP